jgi:ABC-type Fe3+-siderophore transport system permease subunit
MSIMQTLNRNVRADDAYNGVRSGVLAGLLLIAVSSTTGSWGNGWSIGLGGLVTVGGALSYHLLTSVARCPGCSSHVMNFRIPADEVDRKTFVCGRCGTSAYLTEGFYWQ